MPTVNRLREIILSHPEVVTVTSQHGRPDNGSDAAGFFNAEFFVPLKPFDEWPAGMTKEKLIEQLQAEFNKEFVGIDFNFSQYIQDNVEEGLSGVKGANSVKIIGPDLTTLEQIARSALREMAKVPGITDLGAFWVLGQPNLNICDRSRQGGPLRAKRQRRQQCCASCARRDHCNDGSGGRPPIWRFGAACA